MRVILLGTGTSHGVPMIGCDCEVCTSANPKDHRTRPSLWLESDGVCVLIDTSPELRLQCLANNISHCDAVLFTHHHADHVTGLDDLRRFNWLQKSPLNCHAQQQDIDAIKRMFRYAFVDDPDYPSAKPDLILKPIIDCFEVRSIDGNHVLTITPIPLKHGPTDVLGFRIGNFAYCTDCNFVPDTSMDLLQELDVLILDALRIRPHPTHFNLEQAVEWAQRIGAKQTYFTHIAHELKHEDTNQQLPESVALGYDGQVIELG